MILRKTLDKIHKRKIGGYSSTFTMTNVIGFVPAVISCDILTNIFPVFVLIICVICMTTVHMFLNYVAYRVGLNYILHQEDHIRLRERWFKRSADIKSKLLKDENNITDNFLQTHMIYYYVELDRDVDKIIAENRWLSLTIRWLTFFEAVFQWIIAGFSAAIVVMLLHPISKFTDMEYMDIGQIIFTVWLYFINIGILAFRQVDNVQDSGSGSVSGSDSDSDSDSGCDSDSGDGNDSDNINSNISVILNHIRNNDHEDQNGDGNDNISGSSSSSSGNHQRRSFPAGSSSQTIIQMASLGERPNSWPL